MTLDTAISPEESVDDTHRRRISAPRLSFTSCGATTLPSDLDILRPFSSTTKPWVSSSLYGAWPSMAAPVSKDEWNQPRCWSEPSRRSEEHTSELQSQFHLVCRLLLEKKHK